MSRQTLLVLCVCLVGAAPPLLATPLLTPDPDTGNEDLDLHMHDPSRIMERDGAEVVAVTGKEQTIRYACGLELWQRPAGQDGPWRPSACLLEDKPDWIAARLPVDGGAYWAPDFLDPDRIVYSAASDFEDGGPSCLGLLVREGGDTWRDIGRPLVCTDGQSEDGTEISVIDPAAFTAPDGRSFLVTGGGTIKIAEIAPDAPALGLPDDFEAGGWTTLARGPELGGGEDGWVEAAHMHAQDGFFYLFVNWGACCRGAASTYEIRVGRGDGPLGPFLDDAGVALTAGGGTFLLGGEGRMRGPGHASLRETEFGTRMSFHYYDAARGGLPWLGEVALRWEDGWPVVQR